MTNLTPIRIPGGSDGQVQYNNGGAFGGDPLFFWDDANSRLGIGTASPGKALHVLDGAANAIVARFAGDATNRIDFTMGAETKITLVNTNAQQWRFGIKSNDSFFIRDNTAGTVPFEIETSAPTDSLHIEPSGFVGFNTAGAGAQIHVQTSGTGVIGQIIKATAAQTANLFQIVDSTDAALVIVESNGFVGILTSNPGAALEVNGNIEAVGNNAKLTLKDTTVRLRISKKA